jgi:hypothetical protein
MTQRYAVGILAAAALAATLPMYEHVGPLPVAPPIVRQRTARYRPASPFSDALYRLSVDCNGAGDARCTCANPLRVITLDRFLNPPAMGVQRAGSPHPEASSSRSASTNLDESNLPRGICVFRMTSDTT